MSKYLFKQLRVDCAKKPLPEDVNARAVDFINKALAGSKEVLDTLKHWQEKKLFGNFGHYAEVEFCGKKNIIEVAKFEFHWGICRIIYARKPAGKMTLEERTIQNDNVMFGNKTMPEKANTPMEEK